jgi:hypothetical protein
VRGLALGVFDETHLEAARLEALEAIPQRRQQDGDGSGGHERGAAGAVRRREHRHATRNGSRHSDQRQGGGPSGEPAREAKP